MFGFILWLLLLVRTALAGPTMQAAPEESTQRPAIAAPVGGWWTEDGLYARVHATADDAVTSRRLAEHAAEAVPRLAARLGVPAGTTIEIYLAPTQADFDQIQPGVPPEWADGTAWPKWGLVFLRSPHARPGVAEPLEQVLDHELVHVLVGRAFAPRTPPRWLQEGLAQYWTNELGPQTAGTLGSVLWGRERLFSLAQLSSNFYGDPIRAQRAYAASADFVGFLSSRHGPDSVRRLIAEMADGAPFDRALPLATGESMESVEAAWKGRWTSPAAWFGSLLSSNVLWGVAGVLVVIGAWRVRQRTKRTLRRWEKEEEWQRMLAEAPAPRQAWPGSRYGEPPLVN